MHNNKEVEVEVERETCCLVFTSSIKRSDALMTKKCTKKCDARAELLFCRSNLVLFDVLVAVALVAAKAPYKLHLFSCYFFN